MKRTTVQERLVLIGLGALLITTCVLEGNNQREDEQHAKPREVVVNTANTVEEDSPEWNCLTMGNKVCGPGYTPLPPEMYLDVFMPEALPKVCLWEVADTTTIVCTDGTVVTS